MVLDSTKWLSRCSELLKTTNEVCEALCSEGAHVLVAYESGWDRTTQVRGGDVGGIVLHR